MMDNPFQRDAFFDRLYELAKKDKDVVLVVADMSAPALDKFRLELPHQYINVGIAEQNAILVGSGLALKGKKVFAYAIASFMTLRCLEQIRVQNAIQKIPLCVVGIGAGFSYCNDGPTHHILEDVAILRAMPNMTIFNVSDAVMAGKCADVAYESRQPIYVRLDKDKSPVFHDKADDFSSGCRELVQGKQVGILATGAMVPTATTVAESLQSSGISAGVVDVYRFPLKTQALVDIIDQYPLLVSLEEHFLEGGLGSAIAEVMVDEGIYKPLKRLGLSSKLGYLYEYGGRHRSRAAHGIDEPDIIKTITSYVQDSSQYTVNFKRVGKPVKA